MAARPESRCHRHTGRAVLSILYFLAECKQKVSPGFVKGLDKSTKSYIIYMVWTMASIWWDLSRHIGVFYFFRGYEELITMDEYREGRVRIPSGCAISGIFARDGVVVSGDEIIR